MHSLLKKLFLFLLNLLAKRRLVAVQPRIVAITGSVGKTSTKEAIFHVLRTRATVLASRGSYNSEFGLPLTILREESPGRDARRWLAILWRGFFASCAERYDYFVAEFGADAPGDIARLVAVAPPSIGVVTKIAEVHMADGQFASREDIFQEKAMLIRALPADGCAILNGDDALLRTLRGQLPARTILFGTGTDCDVRATNVTSDRDGLRCIITHQGTSVSLTAPILGEHHVGVLLAACAVGIVCGFSLSDCAAALATFHLPKGRLTVLDGRKGTTILDSSYNASPDAVLQALTTLRRFPAKRRIAALGTMNELGSHTERLHRSIAAAVPESADVLVTVGEPAKLFGEGMHEERHFSFQNSSEAGQFLQSFLQEGDVVLVKGSQNNVRMERLIEAIMMHPDQAVDFLVRQSKTWKDTH